MLKPLERARVEHAFKQVFTRKQVLEQLKLSDAAIRRRLESSKYSAPHPGIYVRAEGVQEFLTALVAAVRWRGHSAVVSGTAAGWLHRLDGCDAPQIELTLPRCLRRLDAPGVIVHSATELAPHHVTTIAGLKCMTPARTLVHLCETGAPRNQIVMAYEDNYRRGRRARLALAKCVEELGAGRDLSVLKDLMSRRLGKAKPTDSALEAIADDILWRAGIRGTRQVTLIDQEAGIHTRLDLAFIELKYAFFYDGREFHIGPRPFQTDRFIDRRFQLIGWEGARFTWADVMNELQFIFEAKALLDARREQLFGKVASVMPTTQMELPFGAAAARSA